MNVILGIVIVKGIHYILVEIVTFVQSNKHIKKKKLTTKYDVFARIEFQRFQNPLVNEYATTNSRYSIKIFVPHIRYKQYFHRKSINERVALNNSNHSMKIRAIIGFIHWWWFSNIKSRRTNKVISVMLLLWWWWWWRIILEVVRRAGRI